MTETEVAKAEVPSDIEIAQAAEPWPIARVAESLGLSDDDYESYGRNIGKLTSRFCNDLLAEEKKDGKLILVTAMSPTPAGEGKTTTSVGLADALSAVGKKTMVCLREPSMGPCYGMKDVT